MQLLEFIINDAGWHFRNEKPILDDFLAHIDHPYKSVREAMGRVIATAYRTRYHESFPKRGSAVRGEQGRVVHRDTAITSHRTPSQQRSPTLSNGWRSGATSVRPASRRPVATHRDLRRSWSGLMPC